MTSIKLGQAKVIAAMLLSLALIGVIFAQEAANQTAEQLQTLSGIGTASEPAVDVSVPNTAEVISEQINETPQYPSVVISVLPVIETFEVNETVPEAPQFNEPSVNISVSNNTEIITEPANITGNETIPIPIEINATENQTINITIPPAIEVLSIRVTSIEKITRGESLVLDVTVVNLGSVTVKNVSLIWQLPSGFSAVSEQENCDILEANASCTSEITVQTSLSAELGKNSVKVVVNYE